MKKPMALAAALVLLAAAACSRETVNEGGLAPPADVGAVPPDAGGTPEGVSFRILRQGTGTRRPGPNDTVTVHYTGWTTDGKMFDSSVQRGEPLTIGLNEVIRGWTIGVGLMVEGEKRRLWISESLAYQGQPGAPSGMLVFDVELLKIR